MTFIKNFDLFTMPLEQFEIVSFLGLRNSYIDISINNIALMLLILLFFTVSSYCAMVERNNDLELKNKGFYLIPNRWQVFFEKVYVMILALVVDNIRDEMALAFFPLIFFIFLFIFSLNVMGLIPFTFTLTSQLIMMITLSTAVFIGINIIGVQKHGIHYFTLFLPKGTPVALGLLLVPIELLSFIFKPISLSIRIFANMMAGHTLLKVMAGFAATLMTAEGLMYVAHYAPTLVLIPLFGLELAVAVIQAFVFSVLLCTYIETAMNLH